MGANMLEVGTNQEDGTWHDYAHATLQKDQQESEVVQQKSQADSEGGMKSVKEKKRSHDKRKGINKNSRKPHLFWTKIGSLRKAKESLLKLHYTEVQANRKAHARAIQGSAEKTTRSLKEMAETLEIAREMLTEAEARAVCADEEHEADLKALSEMKSQSEAQSTEVEQLQERIHELQELQIQRKSDAETAEKTKDRHGAELATKDDIISTLKSKLEEVKAAYKWLKGHAKHVQDKLTHETAKNDRLMTSLEALKAQDVALAAELEAVQVELAASRAQSSVMSEESCQQSERAAETVAQHEAQIEVLMSRVSVSDEGLAQTRRQHAIEVQKQKETLQSALAQKEIERLIHGMQRVEEELAHAQGPREEARTCLERHVEAETERVQAALATLETYKKRAHCALKKTSRESKQQVSDAVARTSELQRELDAVKSCITGLESELKDARRCLEEEAVRRGELERVQAEVSRLNDVLARIETPLCAQMTELTARNDALE
ncbi:hypothetical protein PsorP6_017077 [Peronosclerospora sorghi]|uniref:Uncharacterized protein n=1 Tax=Peronosclerospora sorghi TaxID=230839 RepID=A0ACC0WC39_9STRA|nr:hypothetical protein PsorP6_017077 [Peronosclerospora sorghi]